MSINGYGSTAAQAGNGGVTGDDGNENTPLLGNVSIVNVTAAFCSVSSKVTSPVSEQSTLGYIKTHFT